VGGAAQTKAMRQVAGRLRLDLAQFRELAAFAQFGTADLDAATRAQLERGQRLVEVLKQPQNAPLPVAHQVMALFAVGNGFIDKVPINGVQRWENEFHRYMDTAHPEIGRKIDEAKAMDEELQKALRAAIDEFNKGFAA
jgi:F-type H+-transporting ATPase subunit alpha